MITKSLQVLLFILTTSNCLAQKTFPKEYSLKKADSLKKIGDHRSAIIWYKKAIESDPSDKKIFSFMGISKMQVANYIGAIDDLTSYLIAEKDKNDPFTSHYSFLSLKDQRSMLYSIG